jgi:amino acid transporter
MSTPALAPSQLCDREAGFNQLVQHWGKARIDAPLQLIARYDEAGKQLVTIGTTLQTLFTALFFTGNLKGAMSGTPVMLISGSLGLVILLAGLAVCWVHVDTQVLAAFQLFKGSDLTDKAVWDALRSWCEHLHHTVKIKRLFLILAKLFLIGGFGFLLFALSHTMRT